MKQTQPTAARIVECVAEDGLPVGAHLSAQKLADRLQLSRSPVNEALAILHRQGVLDHEKNRGYFIAKPVTQSLSETVRAQGAQESAAVTSAYFRIAEDRLRGLLGDQFTEQSIRARYGLTPAQSSAVLGRIAQEGWATRKAGYGWVFSAMLTTPDSLLQSYRLRLALEPAALLETGYRLEPRVLERCRAAERHLLDGGVDTDTADQLHERGVRFHEALVEASGNPFFIDTIRRVNRVRRLLSYRSTLDRRRFPAHCRQHLRILELLARERNEDAAEELREHLRHTIDALSAMTPMLGQETPGDSSDEP